MSTQSIGLFEAKTHLSELVARAEQGDEVIITRHNRPVARIVPFLAAPQSGAKRREALKALLGAAAKRPLRLNWKTLRDEGRK